MSEYGRKFEETADDGRDLSGRPWALLTDEEKEAEEKVIMIDLLWRDNPARIQEATS